MEAKNVLGDYDEFFDGILPNLADRGIAIDGYAQGNGNIVRFRVQYLIL
ncbi:MAG TPA: hypothetical protein VMB52_04735 [Verrucomicrobiae bacterium]|nr:hypothetical protein [Verrucomicrobiae bacterium]